MIFFFIDSAPVNNNKSAWLQFNESDVVYWPLEFVQNRWIGLAAIVHRQMSGVPGVDSPAAW